MLYTEFLKTMKQCPFCEPITNRVIQSNEKAFLTYSIAPYHKHHLMVVPRRHIANFKELDMEETISIENLLRTGVELLEALDYKDYTILVRNGENVGKSIVHMHYHIVPSVVIGDLDHLNQERKVLTEPEIDELFNQFKLAEAKQGHI